MLGFNFRIGLNSFYQVNKEVTEYAYKYISENIIPNKNTLDLYCGIGTIGIICSKNSKKVVGVEINKESYLDALHNKEINNASNVEFYNMGVNEFIKEFKDQHFENIILDPARSGVNKKTLEILNNEIKPERIIYMSCNPATQAADFSFLKEKYAMKKMLIMDMFPQTYHIETIVILDKI